MNAAGVAACVPAVFTRDDYRTKCRKTGSGHKGLSFRNCDQISMICDSC